MSDSLGEPTCMNRTPTEPRTYETHLEQDPVALLVASCLTQEVFTRLIANQIDLLIAKVEAANTYLDRLYTDERTYCQRLSFPHALWLEQSAVALRNLIPFYWFTVLLAISAVVLNNWVYCGLILGVTSTEVRKLWCIAHDIKTARRILQTHYPRLPDKNIPEILEIPANWRNYEALTYSLRNRSTISSDIFLTHSHKNALRSPVDSTRP